MKLAINDLGISIQGQNDIFLSNFIHGISNDNHFVAFHIVAIFQPQGELSCYQVINIIQTFFGGVSCLSIIIN